MKVILDGDFGGRGQVETDDCVDVAVDMWKLFGTF